MCPSLFGRFLSPSVPFPAILCTESLGNDTTGRFATGGLGCGREVNYPGFSDVAGFGVSVFMSLKFDTATIIFAALSSRWHVVITFLSLVGPADFPGLLDTRKMNQSSSHE